jgi:hypothetical protein
MNIMGRTIAKKTASVSHPILAQAAGVTVTDPVPTEKAPSPPAGYVPTKLGKKYRPQRTQVAIAPKVASELRASTGYAELFGSGAPPAASVADALETATAWSGTLQNATAWYQYVKQQEDLSWQHALGLTDPLRATFDFKLSRDATLAETLPNTASFFGAAKESAKKGVATRKKNEAVKKAATAQPTSPTPPSPPATTAAKLLN